jgi:hypothetical protein
MERLNYWQFPGFENIYLEDSYVLSINDKTSIQILLEAVLTENHSLYTQPLPEEQYCYRRMSVNFPHPQTYDLVLNNISPIADPDGSVDYGNIDEFFMADGKYYLTGEWGELTIVSDPPTLLDAENYLIVKNGENFIEINKEKIIFFEWKRERKGAISLVYENASGSSLSVEIDAEKDPEGFAAFLGYMGELKTGYKTEFTEGDLTFDKIKQYYATNLNQENVQAFSVKFPSSAGDKYSISTITSDNYFRQLR